jgi:uncharacterized protein YegL
MPRLNSQDNLEQFKLQTSHYGFSATRIEDLDASEYTLVTLVFDRSGSTAGFRDEMKKAVDKVVEACKKSPRADNLMFRLCEFSDGFVERHGFKRLSTIGNDYDCLLGDDGGMTALYDASENAISATEAYAKTLTENEFSVNAILFVITDGMDNRSRLTPNEVKKALARSVKSEAMESLVSVLIGVNLDPSCDQYLINFKDDAGFTQYVNIGDATPQKLAKLAEFVSKSISSQSQSLGSGGPSQLMTF